MSQSDAPLFTELAKASMQFLTKFSSEGLHMTFIAFTRRASLKGPWSLPVVPGGPLKSFFDVHFTGFVRCTLFSYKNRIAQDFGATRGRPWPPWAAGVNFRTSSAPWGPWGAHGRGPGLADQQAGPGSPMGPSNCRALDAALLLTAPWLWVPFLSNA